MLAVLDIAIRVDTVRCLWWRSEVIVLCLRLSVLLTEQTECPIGDVEAAEDDNGKEDLCLGVEVSEAA